MPDPIRIRSGSAWKYWPEAGRMIFANRICFRTGSVWPKPDSQPELNQIRAGFAQYDPRRLWRLQPSLKVENWQRAGCVLPETGPDDSCTPTCFQTRCVSPNPDKATQIGSGSVSHNMIHAFFGKSELNRMREVGSGIYDPARLWLHAGRNGHNWP